MVEDRLMLIVLIVTIKVMGESYWTIYDVKFL